MSEHSFSQSIAVVVPARNEEARIAECIRSIRTAGDIAHAALELVVVDDASDDQTGALASALDATVLRQSARHGPLAAWLRGSSATSSPVVFFVDADCLVEAAAFRNMLKHFESGTVGIVAARSLPIQSESRSAQSLVERSAHFSAILLDALKSRLTNHDFLPIGRLMAVRRSALHILRTDRAPCDRALAQWAKQQGWQIVYERQAIVRYQPISTYAQLSADMLRSHARNALPLAVDPLPPLTVATSLLAALAAEPTQALAWVLCHAPFWIARTASRDSNRQHPHVIWDVPPQEPERRSQ